MRPIELDSLIKVRDLGKGAVLLSGASGMLGSAIAKALEQQGTTTLRLVRREIWTPYEVPWKPSAKELDVSRLEGITAAIHLSGANVSSRRWTPAYKQEMTESRVATTRFLAESLARLKNPPAILISASAVGFYGNRGDESLDEDSPAGKGYFPYLCTAWEAATRPAEEAGTRVVHLRFGMVVGRDGGAMARLVPLFKLGLGGRLGNGRQWMSWISEADAVAATLFALKSPGSANLSPDSASHPDAGLSGAVNATAPQPVTNSEFTRELGLILHRPTFLTAPAFALRLALGEMADEALLSSTRALPKRLLDAGFVFTHLTIHQALTAALTP